MLDKKLQQILIFVTLKPWNIQTYCLYRFLFYLYIHMLDMCKNSDLNLRLSHYLWNEVRDHQHIQHQQNIGKTFAILSRFCPLSKPPTPLFLWIHCNRLLNGFFIPFILLGKSVKNCHSMYYFLIIQPLAYMWKYNVSKTGSKMDLLNQQNTAQENGEKGHKPILAKW